MQAIACFSLDGMGNTRSRPKTSYCFVTRWQLGPISTITESAALPPYVTLYKEKGVHRNEDPLFSTLVMLEVNSLDDCRILYCSSSLLQIFPSPPVLCVIEVEPQTKAFPIHARSRFRNAISAIYSYPFAVAQISLRIFTRLESTLAKFRIRHPPPPMIWSFISSGLYSWS